jgi:ribose transport system permease protein
VDQKIGTRRPSKEGLLDSQRSPHIDRRRLVTGPTSAQPQAAPERRRGVSPEKLMSAFSKGGTLFALAVLIVFFSLLRPHTFPTSSNLINVLNQGAVLAMIAGGLTMVLVLGEFDLSISYVASLAGVVVASLLGGSDNITLAIIIALATGAGMGLLNGILVAYVKINAFIATLGTGAIVGGIVLWITDGGEAQQFSEGAQAFLAIGQGKVIGIPAPIIISFVALFILWFILNKTETGRRLDATGGNREAARLSGISVQKHLMLGFLLSGLFAAAGGIVLASELGAGYADAGESFLLQAYTACFLGAVTLRNNEFHIVGTAVGVAILVVTFTGLAQASVPAYWQNIAQGAILILAVSITLFADRLRVFLARRSSASLHRGTGGSPPGPALASGNPAIGSNANEKGKS